jgi:glucose/arabinose dehydrogenase
VPHIHRVPLTVPRARVLLQWQRFLLLAFGLLMIATLAQAASVPVGFNDRQVAAGLTSPTSMAVMPDGRVLVVQQDGIVRIIKADAMLPTNFYAAANVDATNERGCLGVVPDPAFATNHYVYLYCTTRVGSVARNRVLRVTEANDVAVAGSERVIFELPDVPTATKWHMGGAMRFGTDGKLYVAVGNHEDSPQPVATSHSQNIATAFGKILRINADGTIPSDNPFFANATAYKAVWALGFRNPFVLDIQPGTGLTYIGDVGQGSWEEVNRGQPGGNYGWPAVEGSGSNASYINPIYAYSHSAGCSITGTAFYNPATAQFGTSYVGQFFFADFCNGSIKYFNPSTPNTVTTFASSIGNPTNIGIAPSGAMYYLARNQATGTPAPGAGTVGKITYTGSQAPRITQQPQSQTVYVGTAATFAAAADGATSFQWQRNGANISGATAGSYTLATTVVNDTGSRFRAVATNSFGSVTTDEATLTVTTNRAPTARIDTPSATTGFATGDVIAYSGVGTDPEDGNLAAANLTWKVDFQHDTHAHSFITPVSGSSGQFTVPDFEASEANMWLRITLTVRDSSGATNTITRDIFPRTQVSSFPLIGTPANGWGPYEVNRSNGEQGAADGLQISIGGVLYQRGIGVHAPSDLRFNLNRTCSGSLVADLGVDDEVGDNGSVVFQVYLDGVLAYDSGLLTGASLRKTAIVPVANKAELRLVVTDGGNGDGYDHADWGGARVTGCGVPPAITVSNLLVSDGANSGNWSIQSNLQAGNLSYGDRTFTFTAVPAVVAGGSWIRTANTSKAYTGNPLATFAISAAADVYLALDNRSPLPSWVDSSWVDTGADLTMAESSTVSRGFSLFRKRFNAGTVSLGPWNNTGTSMYTVIVK